MPTNDRQPAFSDAYGLPEHIWLGIWSLTLVAALAVKDAFADFGAVSITIVAIIATMLILPQITFRLGIVAQSLGRIGLSLVQAIQGYEMGNVFVTALRTRSYELELLQLEELLFGGQASVALQAIQSPWLTEYFQTLYLFYFPNLLFVGLALIHARLYKTFYEYVVCMNLAFVLTHVVYVAVPLQSPFLVADLYPQYLAYTRPLEGLWFTESLRASLLDATSMRFDCFPSGHTMHTLVGFVFAWRVRKSVGIASTIVAISIIFSTLYLRYHYTLDLFAGVLGAIIALGVGLMLSRRRYPTEVKAEEGPLVWPALH